MSRPSSGFLERTEIVPVAVLPSQQTPDKFWVMTCRNKALVAGNLAPMQP